ncbi:hypothetical protein Taro_014030 [Colocasia esculenta]|uniref:Uncharacterized protein n=1 Tax=Colocasia esculenta TaxID=4460 RepID=A0A843UI71_COLES|nr:hypothetical protein [Colocasia esculenta]
MCGGAIISDFIPPPRSRKVTPEYLWPGLKGESLLCDSKQKRKKAPLASEEDDFEADFKQFGDDSEVDDDEYEVEVLDVKPFAFAVAKTPLGRGIENKEIF